MGKDCLPSYFTTFRTLKLRGFLVLFKDFMVKLWMLILSLGCFLTGAVDKQHATLRSRDWIYAVSKNEFCSNISAESYRWKTPKKSHEPVRLAQLLQNKGNLLSYSCQFLHHTNMTRAYNGNIPKTRGSLGLNIFRHRASVKKNSKYPCKEKGRLLARVPGLQTWPPTISKGLRLVSEKD